MAGQLANKSLSGHACYKVWHWNFSLHKRHATFLSSSTTVVSFWKRIRMFHESHWGLSKTCFCQVTAMGYFSVEALRILACTFDCTEEVVEQRAESNTVFMKLNLVSGICNWISYFFIINLFHKSRARRDRCQDQPLSPPRFHCQWDMFMFWGS